MTDNVLQRESNFYTYLILDNDDFLASYQLRNTDSFRTILSHHITASYPPITEQDILNFNPSMKESITIANKLRFYSYIFDHTEFFTNEIITINVDRIYDELTFPNVLRTKFLFEGRIILNINQQYYNRIKISDNILHTLLYYMFEYNNQ